MKKTSFTIPLMATALMCACQNETIDREALVRRNNPNITIPDTLASLTVGNGGFAFTADVTGLQTFPEYYKNGVPLGTMSDWVGIVSLIPIRCASRRRFATTVNSTDTMSYIVARFAMTSAAMRLPIGIASIRIEFTLVCLASI